MEGVPPGLRKSLGRAAAAAKSLRLSVYAVGGCVRDWMLGRTVRDIDLSVEGEALPLAKAAARGGGRWEAFDRFGTVRVFLPGGLRLDFARARAETYGAPAALPIVRPAAILEDLRRRDFSVNAMARPLGEGLSMLLDPHGGRKDLKDKKLRVLHDKSFQDDPTRLFRAARYAARLGFKLEAETDRLREEAAAHGLPRLLSRERVRQELLLILGEDTAEGAMSLLKRWRLCPFLHKEFIWPPGAERARAPLARLGLAVLSMPEGSAEEFLGSLHLDREQSQALLLALRHAGSRMSPRAPLPELSLQVLAAAFPKLPGSALQPVLLNGEDLKRLGLKPGKDFSRILDEAARAQWRGEFKGRAGALSWLKDNA